MFLITQLHFSMGWHGGRRSGLERLGRWTGCSVPPHYSNQGAGANLCARRVCGFGYALLGDGLEAMTTFDFNRRTRQWTAVLSGTSVACPDLS